MRLEPVSPHTPATLQETHLPSKKNPSSINSTTPVHRYTAAIAYKFSRSVQVFGVFSLARPSRLHPLYLNLRYASSTLPLSSPPCAPRPSNSPTASRKNTTTPLLSSTQTSKTPLNPPPPPQSPAPPAAAGRGGRRSRGSRGSAPASPSRGGAGAGVRVLARSPCESVEKKRISGTRPSPQLARSESHRHTEGRRQAVRHKIEA